MASRRWSAAALVARGWLILVGLHVVVYAFLVVQVVLGPKGTGGFWGSVNGSFLGFLVFFTVPLTAVAAVVLTICVVPGLFRRRGVSFEIGVVWLATGLVSVAGGIAVWGVLQAPGLGLPFDPGYLANEGGVYALRSACEGRTLGQVRVSLDGSEVGAGADPSTGSGVGTRAPYPSTGSGVVALEDVWVATPTDRWSNGSGRVPLFVERLDGYEIHRLDFTPSGPTRIVVGWGPDPTVSDPKASGTVSSGLLVGALAELEPGSVLWQGGIETAARFAAEHHHRFACRAPE